MEAVLRNTCHNRITASSALQEGQHPAFGAVLVGLGARQAEGGGVGGEDGLGAGLTTPVPTALEAAEVEQLLAAS